MSARQRRTPRDERRRSQAQNFLADPRVVSEFLSRAELRSDDLVVEFGAGTGALTLPLAATGVRVVAVESDAVWVQRLRRRVAAAGLAGHVDVVHGDLRHVRLPRQPYRVVASPPFSLTTALLSRLLDEPERGPWRADLLLQRQVTQKRAAQPPTSLRSAVWAPWWTFETGAAVFRRSFRPVPRVDAAWLTIRRREPPVLPAWLASSFADALRAVWAPPRKTR